MNIVIDIGHPGHVHLFRNFSKIMQDRRHTVVFFVRQKECEIDLLEHYKLTYYSLGKHRKSKIGKILGLIIFPIMMAVKLFKFKPDIFLSHGSIYLAIVSKLFQKPHVSFEDTGNMEQIRLYKPFTDVILTSDVFPFNYGEKQIRYKGHHEMAYLNPNYFSAKKISKNYALIRLVSWNASHDSGQEGIDKDLLGKIIKIMQENNIQILISGESELPEELKQYKISIHPHEMLDYLANAKIFIGEGATMAMESAVLGTPAVYVNTLRATNCEDISKCGLCLTSLNNKEIIKFINDSINPDKEQFQKIASQYLDTKIDVTAFLIWFVENYPESVKKMKKNTDYQLRFK